MYHLASLYIMRQIGRDLSFFNLTEKRYKSLPFFQGVEGALKGDGGADCLWRGSRIVVRRR